ncbi:GAF domain-containing protein [Nocardia sp. NPDC005978]|uniref:GAF domain-containing protein n=1 Tax=Nocardia sp. NPDC005978 TaxID=3156725 RepID=UPI0033BC923D
MTAESDAHPEESRPGDSVPEGDVRSLFGRSAAILAVFTGAEQLLEEANAGFLATVGAPSGTGSTPAELLPGPAGAQVSAALDRVYRTGEPGAARDLAIPLGRSGQPRTATFDFTYEPRRDAHGRVSGTRLLGVETTQIKQAQRLLAEQRALVEQIARDAPLSEVLDGMARCIEDLAPEPILVSVLLADPDGLHLRHGAAPSLPDFYNRAIDGIATGEGVGSCGTAAHRRTPVIVTDIGADPFWDEFRELAERAGVAACWSTPLLARDGALLGTFAMYHPTPRTPDEVDLALARLFADTASLAIERHHIETAKARAEAQTEAARAALAEAIHAEQQLRAEAEQRALAATELTTRLQAAAEAQADAPHPDLCQLGGSERCSAAAEIKVADSWGDAAWGCPAHVEEALLNVRSVYIADEELGGLAAYRNR